MMSSSEKKMLSVFQILSSHNNPLSTHVCILQKKKKNPPHTHTCIQGVGLISSLVVVFGVGLACMDAMHGCNACMHVSCGHYGHHQPNLQFKYFWWTWALPLWASFLSVWKRLSCSRYARGQERPSKTSKVDGCCQS